MQSTVPLKSEVDELIFKVKSKIYFLYEIFISGHNPDILTNSESTDGLASILRDIYNEVGAIERIVLREPIRKA